MSAEITTVRLDALLAWLHSYAAELEAHARDEHAAGVRSAAARIAHDLRTRSGGQGASSSAHLHELMNTWRTAPEGTA